MARIVRDGRPPLVAVILVTGVALTAADEAAWAQPAPPAADVCVSDATLADLPVRRVTIQSRGGWQPAVQLPFGPGDLFDLQKLTDAHRVVGNAFSRDPLRDAFELNGRELFSFFFVSSCVTVVQGAACAGAMTIEGRCVDVDIRPIGIRLDMASSAANAVSLPRSNRATSYSQVPAPVRTLNPTFGLSHDSRTGTSETLRLSSDLLALRSTIAGEVPGDGGRKLDLEVLGATSLDEPYYQASFGLRFEIVRTGRFVERLLAFADGAADHLPAGQGRHFENGVRLGSGFAVRIGRRDVNRIVVDGGYRWADHRFFGGSPELDARTDAHAVDARVLLEGRMGDGTWRIGAWHEVGFPVEETFERHSRTAVVGGYQSELGRTEQTVGVEVLAGTGWASSGVPAYAQFHAGSPAAQFLYDSNTTPGMRTFPDGPAIRSLGRAQGSAPGARPGQSESYWHANLNVAFPLPRFSCPLIPAIPLFDDNTQVASANPCRIRRPAPGVKTLKDSLVGMTKTGESFLAADIAEALVANGMDPAAADEEAGRRSAAVFAQIAPAMRFIAQKANLYSIRPLFLLDAASLAAGNSSDVRVGIGGGVQLTVSVAKFEAGYLRGVRRVAADPTGSFMARFVIVNLF